jgi:HSP20 family protein
MKKHLPKTFFSSFPNIRFPLLNLLENEKWEPMSLDENSGLSVYEDKNKITVEAAMPGLSAENIEITFEKGILWIKGEKESEEEGKKYYNKASTSFSYRVFVPGNIDEKKEPEAEYKDGIMKVTFLKKKEAEPKKIKIKKK